MKMQEFASVWDAIEDTPDAAEHMKIRSSLMTSLKQHIKEQGWTSSRGRCGAGRAATTNFRPHARQDRVV